MAWKKYFQDVPQAKKLEKWLKKSSQSIGATTNNQISFLPEVYAGPPNRLERYSQYEDMDNDSQISASLDIIAEFCTQVEEKTQVAFEFHYKDDASESETEILKEALQQWVTLNEFDFRLWRIVRNTILYGDQFFVRDPETFKWLWVDPYKVEKVIVNEAEGKKPEEYWIKDADLNLQTLSISTHTMTDKAVSLGRNIPVAAGPSPVSSTSTSTSRFTHAQNSMGIDAIHMVHISLNEGLDANWPFGNSILESAYKTFKQKSLLEDSILIYRVHRAPERRVFYIDVGNMPANRIMAHLDRVKNEINQRRMPSRTGGGQSVMDSTYNPMSMTEDYFFPQTADGRGSKVETLPGGDNLGQINDLLYFNNALKRSLKVPSSYIPDGPDDGTAVYSDGRATTALIQEFCFSNFCERIQRFFNKTFDAEFKLFLKNRGYMIESSLFELRLNVPQNFAKYRQIELDAAQISSWASIAESRYISKRWALKRYLGLNEDEIVENETMWKQENPQAAESSVADAIDPSDDLRAFGVRPEPPEDLDFSDNEEEELPIDPTTDPEESPLGAGGVSGTPPPPMAG